MIKFIKEKLKSSYYRRILRRYFEPKKGFLKESRALFLRKLKEEGIVTEKEFIRIPLYKALLRYGLTILAAGFILGGGTIILAEKRNVSPDHPLYEFKRLGETIKINLANEAKKPLLHKEFAQRRLEEIKLLKVEASDPKKEIVQNNNGSELSIQKQTIINNLEKDFHKEVNAILNEVEAPEEPAFQPPESASSTEPAQPAEPMESNVKAEKIERNKNLCQSISEVMDKHEEITPGDKEEWSEFNKKCRELLEERDKKLREETENNSRRENEIINESDEFRKENNEND